MGELIRHLTHTQYNGDYDISMLEEDPLAVELSKIKNLKVLSLERGPETGSGGDWTIEAYSHLVVFINHPISQFVLGLIAEKVIDYLSKSMYKGFKRFLYQRKNELGKTINFQYENNVYIFNPGMKYYVVRKALSHIADTQKDTNANAPRRYFFWNQKSCKWEILWEE